MATYETVLPEAALVDGTIAVVDKIKLLSEVALATDSIYMRAKEALALAGKEMSRIWLE